MSLNDTIANLLVEQGRAKASGVVGAGKAMGSALSDLGQTVATVPNVIQAAKVNADQDRARAARNALAKAMKDVPHTQQDGLSLYDVGGIGKTMADQGFGPEFAPAAQHFDAINNSMLQFQQARMATVRTGAQALLQSGADPGLTNNYLDQLEKNQVYDKATISQWREKINAHPEAAKAIVGYLAGPQKLENAAPGSSVRSATTGEIVQGSQAPAEPPKPGEGQHVINGQLVDATGNPVGAPVAPQVDPNVAAREAETTRHNREMERIQGMQVGRESAANAETARHNKAMESANNPLAALQSGAAGAAAAEGAHGDDFLKTLPAGTASEVKAYAEGRRPFPSGMALKSPYFQSLIQMVGQYDPTFDAANYNARNKARTDFTNPGGTGGKTINALNTAIQHAGRLSDLIEALGNGDVPAANFIANAFSRASGGTGVTNFKAVQPQLMKEIERAWRGAGGSSGDIEKLEESLGANMGITQQREALEQFVELMKGKLETTEQQRDNVMGPAAKDIPILYDKSQPILDKITDRAKGQKGGAPSTAAFSVKAPDGKTYTFKSQADLDAFKKAAGL